MMSGTLTCHSWWSSYLMRPSTSRIHSGSSQSVAESVSQKHYIIILAVYLVTKCTCLEAILEARICLTCIL
jgi:hypothetical protein